MGEGSLWGISRGGEILSGFMNPVSAAAEAGRLGYKTGTDAGYQHFSSMGR